MNEPNNQYQPVHITYTLLPPRQMLVPEPILYTCSLCDEKVKSFQTEEHARAHEADSYTLDNVGEHMTVNPKEHSPLFLAPPSGMMQGDLGPLEEM